MENNILDIEAWEAQANLKDIGYDHKLNVFTELSFERKRILALCAEVRRLRESEMKCRNNMHDSELLEQLRQKDELIAKKETALIACYGFFNARIPEHREYQMIDIISDALLTDEVRRTE